MLFLKIIYEIIFVTITSKLYEYIGLGLRANYTKMVLSYVVAIALMCIMQKNIDYVSNYLIYIFFYFTVLPLLCIFWLQDGAYLYLLFCVVSFAIIVFVNRFGHHVGRRIHLRYGQSRVNLELCLLLAAIVILFFVTWKYGLADLRALHLDNIYVIRAERQYSGIFGYLIAWETKAVIPMLIGVSLYNRHYFYTVAAIMVQFYMFLFTANKSVLFSIFFMLGIYVLILKCKGKSTCALAIGMGGLNIIGVVLYNVFNSSFLYSTVSYRLCMVPANISYTYYDFFSKNPKLLFCENFIGRMFGIASPYPIAASHMLGYNGSNANTGLLGDAYANGGIIVMALYAFILGMILSFIDRMVGSRPNARLIASLVAILSYTMILLNDVSLTVTLATGGLLLTLVLIALFVDSVDAA